MHETNVTPLWIDVGCQSEQGLYSGGGQPLFSKQTLLQLPTKIKLTDSSFTMTISMFYYSTDGESYLQRCLNYNKDGSASSVQSSVCLLQIPLLTVSNSSFSGSNEVTHIPIPFKRYVLNFKGCKDQRKIKDCIL